MIYELAALESNLKGQKLRDAEFYCFLKLLLLLLVSLRNLYKMFRICEAPYFDANDVDFLLLPAVEGSYCLVFCPVGIMLLHVCLYDGFVYEAHSNKWIVCINVSILSSYWIICLMTPEVWEETLNDFIVLLSFSNSMLLINFPLVSQAPND